MPFCLSLLLNFMNNVLTTDDFFIKSFIKSNIDSMLYYPYDSVHIKYFSLIYFLVLAVHGSAMHGSRYVTSVHKSNNLTINNSAHILRGI